MPRVRDRLASIRRHALIPVLIFVTACATAPPQRMLICRAAPQPAITLSADGKTAGTRLSVLTYNIEGLPWPARKGRPPKLREIGARLAAMRAAGTGPDIILFQEMFSGSAKRAVADTSYPAIASGPRRTTTAPAEAFASPLPGRAKPKRGEIGLHLLGSGLATASHFPIVADARRAFGRRACAGIDCLSNKGVMLTRIRVPGVPAPIDVYNTHLNSQTASRAPAERRIAAHLRQSRALGAFLAETRNRNAATIFAGDFNMRQSDRRWNHFSRYLSLGLVHRACTETASCDVRLSWDGDAPWMDTQDLQFFGSGRLVRIRPVRIEALFDGGPSGPKLSDHDGFLVTYELTWPAKIADPGC